VRAILTAAALACGAAVTALGASVDMPFQAARPIVGALRQDLLPLDLRGKSDEQLAALWPRWTSSRDAQIRARLEAGDEDSIANLTLFGTSFTRERRITELEISDMAAGKPSPAVLDTRVDAMTAAVAAPGGNERLQFASDVARRKGFDAATAAGRAQVRRWLVDRIGGVIDEYRRRAAAKFDPAATPADEATIFRARGLSSDTSIFPGFAIEQTLDALKSNTLLAPRSVRRVAIIGPGLDFSDKEEGYDFYPQQTFQPFATIDSLMRLGLASPAGVQVTTLDLSPRVNHHVESAVTRARGGTAYVLQLPRDNRFTWTPFMATYWQQFGDRIGTAAMPIAPPEGAGVQTRAVRVRPEIVRAITPLDLDVVLQRLAPLPAAQRFDVVVATNILIYYDVFEQSLALANVASMLKPGGFLITNTELAPLPSIPMDLIGYTDVGYTDRPEGDRCFWYQKTGT
jgi:hypothetical protein